MMRESSGVAPKAGCLLNVRLDVLRQAAGERRGEGGLALDRRSAPSHLRSYRAGTEE